MCVHIHYIIFILIYSKLKYVINSHRELSGLVVALMAGTLTGEIRSLVLLSAMFTWFLAFKC